MTTIKLQLNPDKTEFLFIGHKRQRLKYLSMFPVTLLGSGTHPSKIARKILVLRLMTILISGLTSTMFANFPAVMSATCGESESIWTCTKSSAWRLPLCPVGLTTATPCCMGSQTCSSSREYRTVLPGWSPGLVALHLAFPFVTLSTGYPFPSEFSSKYAPKHTRPSLLVNQLILLILSIWPHPTGTHVSTKALSYLLLSARLRPELEFSAFVHLLSEAKFPCVSDLLNPWLVFVNV